MLGKTWYFGLIRKYVTIFGTLFNDIIINRVDSDSATTKSITVPIAYGPKERYLTRLNQNDDLLRPVSLVYPRMAFEITDVRYDPESFLHTVFSLKAAALDLHTMVFFIHKVILFHIISDSDLLL